jgi:hypothetical protein
MLGSVRSEPVQNGNDLALELVSATPQARPALINEHLRLLHTFRYLRVKKIETLSDEKKGLRLETQEPSSDMTVILNIRPFHKVAYKIAQSVKTNDCVRGNGRIIKIQMTPEPMMLVDPTALHSKDRSAPKGEKEMLSEIDPTAVVDPAAGRAVE